MLEAGTSLTPASWHGKSAGNQSRTSLPHTSVTSDTSDSDADSTFTTPSGRLNAAGSKSSPSISGHTKPMFRVSPSSNRSPQTSFRLKNFSNKGSTPLAEDSVSLSNRSDSSSHQDHLADAHPQVLDCRPTSWSVPSPSQTVHRPASRTRSPQRVAPAPGARITHVMSRTTPLAQQTRVHTVCELPAVQCALYCSPTGALLLASCVAFSWRELGVLVPLAFQHRLLLHSCSFVIVHGCSMLCMLDQANCVSPQLAYVVI